MSKTAVLCLLNNGERTSLTEQDMELEGKILKVRWVKPYAQAHGHVAIGVVLRETAMYLMMMCKTYHCARTVGGKKGVLVPGEYVGGILEGEKSIRIIPWSKVEVANELPDDTDWEAPACIEENGLCRLDNRQKTMIIRPSSTDI